jgi:hypothetical protein
VRTEPFRWRFFSGHPESENSQNVYVWKRSFWLTHRITRTAFRIRSTADDRSSLTDCLCRPRSRDDFALRLHAANLVGRGGDYAFAAVIQFHRRKQLATTQTLNAKYPDWTQEDWDRFRWINSWNRRRRNLAPLLPCKRCGTAAIFEEDHGDMPYHNMFTLGCPKCHRYLETTTRFEPDSVWGWFRQPEMYFFGGTESNATAHGAAMELLQFSRH